MLNIYNNDVDRTPYNFNIQGDGLIPEINLQGNSTTIADGDTIPTTTDHTDFGNQDVASGTVSRTFTIQNTGTGVLKLGTNAVSLSGGQSGDFSITAQPATTVASSGSSTFIIQFDPSVMGERKTTVSINSDDSDENPYNFSIKGNGLSPEISISGNSIEITDGDTTPSTTDYTDFGSLLVASETLSRTFTVTNSGNSALTLTGTPHIAINGVNAADFTITVDATSPVASSGGTTTFTVRFDPSATGTRTASITIDNNDTNENPYNFEIEGLGHSLPTVTADAATNVVQKSATLNGTVNANDDTTTVVFEYGLTTGYGSTVTANPDTITGHTDTSVSKSVSGLTPSTTYHYRVVGNNSAGTSNGNDQAFTTLDCINPTAAGTIGNAQQICNGSNPSEISSLSLPSGNSGVLEYKWQQSTTSSTTGFSDISNSNSTTYDPSNLTTTTWYKRLVRVDCKNDWSGALESNAIKITVLLLMEAGTISANQSICYNTVFTKLTGVAPTGGKAPYTYQWQSSTDGINFSDISGETNLDYQAPALTTTTYYQLEQTSSSGCGTVSTNVVKIKVYGEFTVGSIPGFKVIYYRNAPEKFIGVAPTGGKQPYSYQWQSSTNGTKFTDIYGATSLDYQAGRLRRTTYFQLKQSSASGCGIFTTNRLTVVVFPKFIVGSISADQHIAYNSAPEKLIGEKPRGGRQPYSYQWQSSGDGINFTNIVGATKLDYQPGTLTDTTYFQLIQSSSHDYAEKNTNMVSIYVYPEFKVGSISEDQNVCYNSAPDMLMGTEPSGGNLPYTYQWQSSTDGINFTDIAGASLLNYRPNVLTETTYFQQIQTSANACGSFTTNIVTMGIKLPPTVFSGNDVAGICANEDYQLSGSVENYESLVWTTSGDGSFSDINVLNPVYTPGSNDNINGSATLTLIANPEAPCSNPVSDELILSFNQIPLVDAGNDLTIYENSQVQITASVQGNGNYSYSWSPAAMLSDPTILNPLTNPISETTTFTIEVSDNETGCVVEDQVTFKVETGVTYQISGSISSTNLKNSLPVTEVYFTGIQEKTTTNNLGEYTMLVPAGYSGWAIPLRPGYIFEPDSIPFFNVGVDIVDQNYGGILYINAFAEPDTLILELGQSSQLGVELIGSQDPITDYRWFDQDGNLQSSEANPIVEPTETTLYTVYVEDALERSYDTVRVTVVSNVGIDDLNNNNQISIYPNPAKDLLYIDIGTLKVADNLIITITDLNGKIMFREDVKDTISEIDVSTFKPSLYFVEIRTSENSKKLKLIIE